MDNFELEFHCTPFVEPAFGSEVIKLEDIVIMENLPIFLSLILGIVVHGYHSIILP
jgi:hypothetical protein